MEATDKTRVSPGRPWEEFLAELMEDPEFVQAYREMEPEFQAAREVLRLRLARGLTQEELARRVGTQQASISRLERATVKPSLRFLQRVAEALDAHLVIRLVPKDKEKV